MDLIIQDSTRVGVAYFLMSEENVRKQAGLHWVSFGSDEGSYTTEGVFLKSNAHPRAYGNFARFLGKYVREDKVCSLQEAIYKLAKLPADHLRLKGRGMLKPGYFADVVIFDPETIADHSTFEKPHQYSTGVSDVWVNGKQVLNVAPDEKAQSFAIVPDGADQVAALSEGRKLLVFPLEQVPEMNRGRGVTLQKSKNDRLADAIAFVLKEGLPWGNRVIPAADLKFWRGERAQAGRMPEKGWPRAKRFRD